MLTVGFFLTHIPAIPGLYSEFGFIPGLRIPGLPARVEETMPLTPKRREGAPPRPQHGKTTRETTEIREEEKEEISDDFSLVSVCFQTQFCVFLVVSGGFRWFLHVSLTYPL